MHRISVAADETITAQARTYAEYRLFATLARHAPEFQCARVLLYERTSGRCPFVTCSLTIATSGQEPAAVRILTAGPHPYAAINRAVEQLAARLGRNSGSQQRNPATESRASRRLLASPHPAV